jgi:hypothetical protein
VVLTTFPDSAAPVEPLRPKLDPLNPLQLRKIEQGVLCNELLVSIDALGRQIAPNVELRSDPWLFQYLVARPDRRVMAALPEIEGQIALPTSINLSFEASHRRSSCDLTRACAR